MAIEIDKEFEVGQPPDEVWEFLITPERVVECLPGAELTEQVDDRTYRGEMGVKLGPMGVTFQGTIHFDEIDREAFRVRMSGEGSDRKGAGRVKMTMESRLAPTDAGGTRVSIAQTVNLSGRLASFGRGGIIQNVADFMLGRFTRCVERKLGDGTTS